MKQLSQVHIAAGANSRTASATFGGISGEEILHHLPSFVRAMSDFYRSKTRLPASYEHDAPLGS